VVVPNTASKNAATIDDVSNVKASGRAKFSADLFVLDLGLKGDYSLCEDVSIFAAVGPTLTYARMDSSTYSTFSSNGVKLASSKCVDDKDKCRFGYYVSGGAQYDFCENWALSAELRWDDAFGKLETKVAEQRLDSLGGVLKVIYNF